jgi:hypothetical protein
VKRVLLTGIRAYRRIRPRSSYRRCLYYESCSVYVERTLCEKGFLAALAALVERVRGCRPGYRLEVVSGQLGLRLQNGTFLPADQLAAHVIAPSRPVGPFAEMQ